MRRFTNVIFLPQTIFAMKFLKLYREAVQETDVFMEKMLLKFVQMMLDAAVFVVLLFHFV